MRIRSLTLIAISLTATLSHKVFANDISIYRWIDDKGIVHFSQQLPQHSNYSQLTTFSSYKAKQQVQEQKNIESKIATVDEQLAQHEKQQKEISEKNNVIKQKNCEAAQLNLKMLNSSNKITTQDSDGKNHVLTTKEKKEKIILSKKHIELYCNNSDKKN